MHSLLNPRLVASLVFLVAVLAGSAAPIEVNTDGLAAPQQPRIAIDDEGAVFVAFGSGDEIYVSRSNDGGHRFERAVKVGTLPKLSLGMRRGPRIVATGAAVTVTAINHHDVFAFHSEDGGRSWSDAFQINRAAGSASEGLHDLAHGPKGEVFVVWLDDRSKAMEVYGARSVDGGKSWRPDELVYRSPDGHVCECCHPSAMFNTQGDLAVMWRNWIDGSRDLWTAVRLAGSDHFEAATKQGDGTWKLAGCPMDGGALFTLSDGAFATTWRRDKDIFVALEPGTERRIGEGTQPVALQMRSALHIWWQQGANLMHATQTEPAAPAVFATDAKSATAATSPKDGSAVIAFEGAVAQRKAIFVDVLRE